MLQRVCTLYDSAAQAYMPIFITPTKTTAERGFLDLVNDGKSNVWAHPEDYVLFELGTWDEHTGLIVLHESKQVYGCALDYVRK